MVQLQEAVGSETIPRVQRIEVAKFEVVNKRFHRVTLQWNLNCPPTPEWVAAFGSAVVAGEGFLWHVPSAYGQPMVMHDQTIVWAMFETEATRAAKFVTRSIARANSQFDDPPDWIG